jgi:hypothetical protein
MQIEGNACACVCVEREGNTRRQTLNEVIM